MQHKPRPQHRIDRPKPLEIHDDSTHLWAVSYSDLLMVLLSFFILFFSMGEKKQDILHKLIPVADVGNGELNSGARSPSNSTDDTTAASSSLMNTRTIANVAKAAGLEASAMGDSSSVLIVFPKDIYPRGKLDLANAEKAKLKDLLNSLSPNLDKLKFEFIGHSDAIPIGRTQALLQDNFELSSLRATRAIRYALSVSELHPEQVTAKGSGSQKLSSRTLSIAISLREPGT